MHVAVGDAVVLDQAKLNQFATDIYNTYGLTLLPHLSQSTVLQQVECIQTIDSLNFLTAIHTGTTNGQDQGFTLPANVSLVLSWKSAAHYRGGHPRTYLCGLVSDRTANNIHWTPATVTEFQSGATQFLSDVNGDITSNYGPGGALGFYRVYAPKGSTENPPVYLNPPAFYAFTAATVHSRIDSQRRRLGRETV